MSRREDANIVRILLFVVMSSLIYIHTARQVGKILEIAYEGGEDDLVNIFAKSAGYRSIHVRDLGISNQT